MVHPYLQFELGLVELRERRRNTKALRQRRLTHTQQQRKPFGWALTMLSGVLPAADQRLQATGQFQAHQRPACCVPCAC